MRGPVNVFVALGSAATALSLLMFPSLGAGAEEPKQDDAAQWEGADRWVPSLAIISGVTVQKWKATASGQLIPMDPNEPTSDLRPPVSGNDLDVTPFVGGSFELMTPKLPLPASPRVVIGADLMAAFPFNRKVAIDGNPGAIEAPFPEGTPAFWKASDANGQGSETTAEMKTLVFGAHLGLSFPFEFMGRAMRVKPGIGWFRYEVKADGLFSTVQCLNPPPIPPFSVPTTCNAPNSTVREIQLSSGTKESFDGIGPRIDLELDTGRFGPVGSSLFVGARAYRILGERKVTFEASQTFDDAIGNDTAAARWTFEVNPWMYRAELGMRFHWLGSLD